MKDSRLDISIPNIQKLPKKKFEELLQRNVSIEEKYDGVKINIIKIENNKKLSDYIVSYKNEILYPDEFCFLHDSFIDNSHSSCQFKRIFQHLFNNLNNNISVGTELFIEFIMKKPTLSSQYTKVHDLVLIGYSNFSSYKIEFGKIYIESGEFKQKHRDLLAKELNLLVPQEVFTGKLEDFWEDKDYFMKQESRFGGLEEGYVITDILTNEKFKLVQDYQYNKVYRDSLKGKFQEPQEYWDDCYEVAKWVITNILRDSFCFKNLTQETYPEFLKDCCISLSSQTSNIMALETISQKTYADKISDIKDCMKRSIIKKIKGNNNALIIGKFRVITKIHREIIYSALEKYDNVIICLVTSKDTQFSREFRLGNLEKTYKDKVEIIEHSTANIFSIFKKTRKNISAVICGTDRYDDYSRILKDTKDTQVIEIKRDDNSISATKVIENINDYSFYLDNIHSGLSNIHDYDYFKDIYGSKKVLG